MNYKYAFFTILFVSGVIALTSRSAQPQEKPRTPADGHEIHVLAPHKMDGKVMGPYHHYCKAVSSEVLECLIYESTEPNALLKQVEYFVAKSVSRTNVPLETWNKFYHDHAVEIATGHELIERGMYRVIRHPSYTGLLLSFLGLGFAFRNWISLAVVMTVTFLALSYRVRVEEAALIEHFGDRYREYMKRTKRFIPGLL